jgi:hypothetical protein
MHLHAKHKSAEPKEADARKNNTYYPPTPITICCRWFEFSLYMIIDTQAGKARF